MEGNIKPEVIIQVGDMLFQRWPARRLPNGEWIKENFQLGKLSAKRVDGNWKKVTKTINVDLGDLVHIKYLIDLAIDRLKRRS